MVKHRVTKSLAKRVRTLEVKQDADDKEKEFKVTYYSASQLMDNTWLSNYGMTPRTSQGAGGETAINSADPIRLGNQINLRYLSLTGIVKSVTNSIGVLTNRGSCIPCRIIIVDNLTDNTGLDATDVLQNPTAANPDALTSSYKNKVAGGKRYRVYADYKFTLSDFKPTKMINFKMPLPKSGRVLHYNGNLDTIPSDFNLSVLFFADTSVGGGNQPSFHFWVKSRFTDA